MKRKLSQLLHPPLWDHGFIDEDAILVVCAYCDLNDLLALRKTCSYFRRCAKDQIRIRNILHLSSLVSPHIDEVGAGKAFPRTRGSSGEKENRNVVDHDGSKLSTWMRKDKQEVCVGALLKELAVESHSDRSASISIECKKFKYHLRHLDLSNLRLLTTLPIFHEDLIRSLLVLDLSNCARLDPEWLINLSSPHNGEELPIPSSSPPLKELYLTGCRRVNEKSLKSISNYFVNLQTLHLGLASQSIGDSSLSTICFKLKKLQSLELTGLNKITNRGSLQIFCQLRKLKYLNVNGCEKMNWNFLSLQCNILREWLGSDDRTQEDVSDLLNLARNGQLDSVKEILSIPVLSMDVDIFSLKLEVARLSFGPNIRGGIPRFCLSLLAISSMGMLREVDVSGSTYVSNDDIQNLAYTCRDSLKSLEVRCCRSIGDPSLQAIAKFAKLVVFLDISACFSVTDTGLKSLGQGCLELITIKMSSLGATNEGINSFRHLKKLLVLDVNNCPHITELSINLLLLNCTQLLELDVRNTGVKCANLRNEERHQLVIFNGKRYSLKQRHDFYRCCTARNTSQRLNANQGSVQLRRMYHCVDCNLVPCVDRGMCHACAVNCHEGHYGVYFSCITTFYCDCAFGFQQRSCYEIFPP